MATLQQQIPEKFLVTLTASGNVDADEIGKLRKLFAGSKKIKAEARWRQFEMIKLESAKHVPARPETGAVVASLSYPRMPARHARACIFSYDLSLIVRASGLYGLERRCHRLRDGQASAGSQNQRERPLAATPGPKWVTFQPTLTTAKLARRIWLAILMKHLDVNPKQRQRAKPLIDFDVPLRRQFPISQPSILKRLDAYNKSRSYDFRVKPFGFVQRLIHCQSLPLKPIFPDQNAFRGSISRRASRFDWTGMEPISKEPLRSHDWTITSRATAAIPKRRPPTKMAIRPVLIRSAFLGAYGFDQRSFRGSERRIDRLDQDEGAALEVIEPIHYKRDTIADDIAYLAGFPQRMVAADLGLTERDGATS
jgi:hypothetical protein